ncbi:MAG TPA: hypothetical protein VEC99_03765 [Clostridia bacterium]|nr:hypothetical protein [Clostridia bacterium]
MKTSKGFYHLIKFGGRGATLLFLLTSSLVWNAHSGSCVINVLRAEYSTDLSTTSFAPGTNDTSRSLSSREPISDSLIHPVLGVVEAEATAGFLEVSAFTAAEGFDPFRASAEAVADVQIYFTPVHSQTKTLEIQLFGWLHWWYSGGFITLSEVSSGQELWGYEWHGASSGNVPWVFDFDVDTSATATLTPSTQLEAGKIYCLKLHCWTISNPPDSERVAVRVLGLARVKAPTPLALLQRLVFMVDYSDIRHSRSLQMILQAAEAAINRGNLKAAANQIRAFKQKVNSQVAPCDPALAQEMAKTSQLVIDALKGKAGKP